MKPDRDSGATHSAHQSRNDLPEVKAVQGAVNDAGTFSVRREPSPETVASGQRGEHHALMRLRLLTMLVVAFMLAGCGSLSSKALVSRASPITVPASPTTITVGLARSVVEPATGAHPARQCWASADTAYVTVDLNPDTPNPTCASVASWQRIALVNRTDAFGQRGHQLSFVLAPFPEVNLKPEETVRFDRPVGDYLAPGDHEISPTAGFTGFEIYVRDTASAARTPSASPTHARPQGTLVVTADPARGDGQGTSLYVGCTEWTVEVRNNSDTVIRSATFTAKEADYFIAESTTSKPAPLPPPSVQYINLAPGQSSQLRFQWCQQPYPSSEPGSYEVIIGAITFRWITGEEGRTCLGCS